MKLYEIILLTWKKYKKKNKTDTVDQFGFRAINIICVAELVVLSSDRTTKIKGLNNDNLTRAYENPI